MTYLDVVFSYGSMPGENELRAIDSMREVYGIRACTLTKVSAPCGCNLTLRA